MWVRLPVRIGSRLHSKKKQMTKYKLSTWKLETTGEFESEEAAIRELSDRYMQCSKCDPPGEHPIEHLSETTRTVDTIAKRVYFYVQEKVYGNLQWVHKLTLNIYPFKPEHWWEPVTKESRFKPEAREFKYELVTPTE